MENEILYINNNECPFCKSEDLSKYQQRADKLWVLLCNNCQLGFVEKYPENLQDLYDIKYYEKSQDDIESPIGYSNYKEIDYDYFIWAIALVALTKSKGSLFDLGCSNGLFLDLAKSYGCTDLSGVELATEYAEICKSKSYNVYNMDFLNIEFEANQKYDIVTAWAVLEHIPQLNETFQQIKSILKEDGVLFFEVPCLTFNETDKYWLDSSLEHIYYFTKGSFNTIAKKIFGNLPISQVVDVPNYGSSLVGFVTSSQSKLIEFYTINTYLNWINKVEMENIEAEDLINYFIFHFRYTQNIQVCKNIAEYLNKEKLSSKNHFQKLENQYWAYISKKLVKSYLDNQDYIEAKEYFLSKISSLESGEQTNQAIIQQTQSQLQQIQSESQVSQARLQQTQSELQVSQAQLQQTQSELQVSQAQLQQTQSELQVSQTQLQQTQSELQVSQTQLQQTQSELQVSQTQLQQTQSQLCITNEEIEAMKSSKFWKLRNKWFKLKKFLGLEKDNNSKDQPNLVTTSEIFEQSSSPEPETNKDIPGIIIETIEQELWSQDNPLVSVIIPCFNYGQYLEEAIQSVLHQTLQNLEIIVVNDGSTDISTIEILENLNFPRTVVIHQENQKLPNTRNNGIKNAKGKYICCLDADDLLRPTYLEKCVAKMEAENLDVCYTWLQEFGESDTIRPSLEFNLEELIQYNGVIVSAVFKRDIWQKVEGYNALMLEGYEDWDFWIRLAKAGGLGGVVKEPLFLYRKHGHSMFNKALDKHSSLYAQIQAHHRELYENQELVKQIVESRKQYIVSHPYLNLLSSYRQANSDRISSKNILFALPCLATGGAEKVLLNLVKILKQEDFNITIFTSVQTPSSMGDNTSKFRAFTEEIYPLYSLFDSSQWESFIYYLIESRQINLIFLSGSSYFYDMLPGVKQNFPYVKVIDQQYNEVGHMDNNRRYAEYIDMNIVENETVKDFLLVKSQEKIEKVVLIPNGVDTEYFNPSVELKKTINLDDDLVKNKFIVTFLGRFSIEKAPHIFVEIVNYLKDNTELYFIMAGNGPCYDEVYQLIYQYDLTDKIYLPSFVDARECLKLSNVLILPSTIDGRPNAVLEGLSMGVPVIASAVGGLPDLVKDGYNGYLCEPGDVERFVERIQILSQDATLYEQLKKNARFYAETHLNLVAQTKQKYLTVFEQLLSSV